MSDRELLELAAKAAALSVEWDGDGFVRPVPFKGFTNYEAWNPLTDDGDALRMAVKLRITVKHDDPDACCAGWAGNQRAPTTDGVGPWYWKEWNGGDPLAATRRAIVRAAAEIGKAMQ